MESKDKQPLTAEEVIRNYKNHIGDPEDNYYSETVIKKAMQEYSDLVSSPLLKKIAELETEKTELQKEHDRYKELFYDYAGEVEELQLERTTLECKLSVLESSANKLAEALKELCQLKKYKDDVGKDNYYETRKLIVWKNANNLITTFRGENKK